MKKKYLVFFSWIAIAGIITVFSCKKEEDKTVTKQDAAIIAKNDAVSDAAYNDIYSESEDVLSSLENSKYNGTESLKSATVNGTRTITVTKNSGDTTVFPKEITVTYSNYVTSSGIKKNGTLKITQSARMRKPGAVRTVALENFTVNDTIQLEGKKTITNQGFVDGKFSIKEQLDNGKITFASGNYITRNFSRTISATGFITPFNIWDDVYTFDESASGVTRDGISYSTKTTVPLEYKVGEFCIKKGQIEINVADQIKATIDFTRTDCLSKVKLTIEGEVQNMNI
jgi:hypothetical protein